MLLKLLLMAISFSFEGTDLFFEFTYSIYLNYSEYEVMYIDKKLKLCIIRIIG